MFIKTHEVLYLHPGKCGGTSVEKWLAKVCDLPDFKLIPKSDYGIGHDLEHLFGLHEGAFIQHADFLHSMALLRRWHPDVDPYKIYTFATVRDPIARLKSAFKYSGMWKRTDLNTFVLNELENKSQQPCSHFLPQNRYTHIKGKQVVDKVIKLEHLDRDISKIAEVLNVEDTPMERANKSPLQIQLELSDEAKAKVLEVYYTDYALYGYSG